MPLTAAVKRMGTIGSCTFCPLHLHFFVRILYMVVWHYAATREIALMLCISCPSARTSSILFSAAGDVRLGEGREE